MNKKRKIVDYVYIFYLLSLMEQEIKEIIFHFLDSIVFSLPKNMARGRRFFLSY